MTQRERESLAPEPVGDPHFLLFGDRDGEGDRDRDEEPNEPVGRMSRADRRRTEHSRHRRRHRRGWLSVVLAAVIVAVVATYVTRFVINHFRVADYSGGGAGSVSVTIASGATANDIGALLQKADVVKSTEAFTDAASDNSKSQSIQPGTYTLRKHMSAKAALNALLDPSSRSSADRILVPEGVTSLDVATRLATLYGATQQPAIRQALGASAELGVPVNYKTDARFPASAEGFLYPATYTFDPGDSPREALSKMVLRFVSQDRTTGFAADAANVGLTPYQALIVASIAQSEAKYAADMPKVVRTILTRIKVGRALQFDSTSSYACKLSNEKHCIYNQVDSPYNTYQHKGLPPTPIDNPGAEAMAAAVHPAAGNWLFFVNKDSSGHLFFTHDDQAFEKARQKCVKNNWGCG